MRQQIKTLIKFLKQNGHDFTSNRISRRVGYSPLESNLLINSTGMNLLNSSRLFGSSDSDTVRSEFQSARIIALDVFHASSLGILKQTATESQ